MTSSAQYISLFLSVWAIHSQINGFFNIWFAKTFFKINNFTCFHLTLFFECWTLECMSIEPNKIDKPHYWKKSKAGLKKLFKMVIYRKNDFLFFMLETFLPK